MQLYRDTQPHPGFEILRRWCAAKPRCGFVFTSNVDGHFQRAGFPDEFILECHGSIHHLQCIVPCRQTVWPAEGTHITVDESTMRAREPLPRCPACGALARPAILMFGDWNWVSSRTETQEDRLRRWLNQGVNRLAVVEIGAGRAVPTVRNFSERIAEQLSIRLIRINPREPEAPREAVSLPMGGLAALQALDALGV